ncbi:MAG: aldehyde dehydrogenase family protein [Alphaproteobacteria bacterium]
MRVVENLLIGQKNPASHSGATLGVVDPADGGEFGTIARGNGHDIELAVQAGEAALAGPWGKMPALERGRLLTRLAGLIERDCKALARLECRDVGKRLVEAQADARAAARYFEFYGGAADKVTGQTIPFAQGYSVFTWREPHGVTGHIVPWNYPLQIVGRSIGAALAMGNACVVKPAEDASLSTLALGRLALEAGLPPGALNVVTGLGAEAGAALASHPRVAHISFTGSPEAGAQVQAAAAAHSAPVTLELGGKSPQIVFADADLDAAIASVVGAIVQNAGQTCSAGSRVLIEKNIYQPFVAQLAERFENLKVGPGLANLDCGPLISARQQSRVMHYLDEAAKDGIAVLAQGSMATNLPAGGFYVRPTLLGDVPRGHKLAEQEIFGPVLVAQPFDDEADAIELANSSDYGLVAGIWTRDGGRQFRLARAIAAGQIFINNFGAAGGVELPFGGVKRSGHGREKGFEALYGFSQIKTVAVKHD